MPFDSTTLTARLATKPHECDGNFLHIEAEDGADEPLNRWVKIIAVRLIHQ